LRKKILLIGASTGGPAQIKKILSQITSLSCTIVIAQHMKEEVLPFFIHDLQEKLSIKVESTPLSTSFSEPSVIVCASSVVLKKRAYGYEFVCDTSCQCYTPDINQLFHSFSHFTSDLDIEALVMTGIGRDGTDGAIALKQCGAKILAEDEQSSPVYGMPKAVVESGAVDEVKSLDEIIKYIKSM